MFRRSCLSCVMALIKITGITGNNSLSFASAMLPSWVSHLKTKHKSHLMNIFPTDYSFHTIYNGDVFIDGRLSERIIQFT